MKEYINPLLRVFTVVALIAIVYTQHRVIQTYKQGAEPYIDSVLDEVFILKTQVGRYEMAAQILREEDSLAGDKFDKILNKETE